MQIYFLYCSVFNGLIPFDISLQTYFPDFYEKDEHEKKIILSSFLIIHNTILEQMKIKEEMKRKAMERKNKNKGKIKRR